MSRFLVVHPSIGRALRKGIWFNLGLRELRSELADTVILVQWPVGSLDVTIWKGGSVVKTTKAHDPEIQTLEIFAAHDAISHVPQRIRADFSGGSEDWSITSNVRHERRKKEALARLHSDKPWHALHPEWVSVDSET